MRLALAFLMAAAAMLAACNIGPVNAAELPRKGKIAAPPGQQTYVAPTYTPAPAEPAYKVHNWYVGGVAGYNFGVIERTGTDGYDKPFTFVDGDETWQAGVVAGYLWRSAVLGLGIEADYVVRDLAHFRLDDGAASIRGRAGVFVGDGTFVYGTAGVAQATPAAFSGDLRKGLVVGGGIEKDIAPNLALRVEALHYRHGGDYFEWGEESSTAVRGGLLLKF